MLRSRSGRSPQRQRRASYQPGPKAQDHDRIEIIRAKGPRHATLSCIRPHHSISVSPSLVDGMVDQSAHCAHESHLWRSWSIPIRLPTATPREKQSHLVYALKGRHKLPFPAIVSTLRTHLYVRCHSQPAPMRTATQTRSQ